ncbi:MAG: DNA polymerase III subunit [Candidatus Aquicultorales bacterium]
MDAWDGIIGHGEVVRRLRREVGAPSHAYLFTGPAGIGKGMAARAFASALNCPSGGCGTCASCKKTAHGVHPDVHILEPAGKSEYLMGQIVRRATSDGRVVVEEANRSPFEGRRKIFIFEQAERLSEEASNALLKTLEEPPGDTVFILLAEAGRSLLPTVVSRCQVVHFFEKDEEEPARLLATPSVKARRERVLEAARSIEERQAVEVSVLAEELVGEANGRVEEAKKRLEAELERAVELAPSPQLAARSRKLLEEKGKRIVGQEEQRGLDEVVTYIESWYRDALVLSIGADESLIRNKDMLDELRRAAAHRPRALMACLEAILDVRKVAAFNVNMQMSLEAALFRIQEELSECPP